jgi:hypothetical protein
MTPIHRYEVRLQAEYPTISAAIDRLYALAKEADLSLTWDDCDDSPYHISLWSPAIQAHTDRPKPLHLRLDDKYHCQDSPLIPFLIEVFLSPQSAIEKLRAFWRNSRADLILTEHTHSFGRSILTVSKRSQHRLAPLAVFFIRKERLPPFPAASKKLVKAKSYH